MTSFSKKYIKALFFTLTWSLLVTNSWAGTYADSSHGDTTNGVTGIVAGFEKGNCAHCHDQHASRVGSTTTPRDYLGSTTPNTLCTNCHDGSPASTNIKTFFDIKTYTHGLTGTHTADESRAELSANIHVHCTDCHNPHVAQSGVAVGTKSNVANVAPGVLLGAPAVNPTWGTEWAAPVAWAEGHIDGATYNYEWQVCFRCHSSYNQSLSTWDNAFGNNWTDVAVEFTTSNASYHPVVQLNPNRNTATAGDGSGQYGPVFVNGWTKNSTMQCSDCHTDATAGTPNGPHGTNTDSMLIATYDKTTGENNTSDHLCFKCHDYAAYAECGAGNYGNCGSLGPYKTGFSDSTITNKTTKTYNLHVYHVFDKQVTCTGCHLLRIHGAKAGSSGGPADIDRGLLLWDANDTDADYIGAMKFEGSTTTFYQQITTWRNSGGWTSDSQCDYNQTTSHR